MLAGASYGWLDYGRLRCDKLRYASRFASSDMAGAIMSSTA